MTGDTKRFKKVLHVREVERQITQGELADQMREETELINKLGHTEAKRDMALADFCKGHDMLMSPQQLWFERQNIDMMERAITTERAELESCRVRIERTKGALVERHRSVQLMEHHVGKLQARDRKLMLAAEQNEIDDITSMRFLMNRRGGYSA